MMLGHGGFHRRALVEVERQRLFAEDRFLRLRGGDDDLAVILGRRHHDDRIHRLVGEEVLVVCAGLEGAGFFPDGLGDLGSHVGNGMEPRARETRANIAGILAAEAAQPDYSEIQDLLIHGGWMLWVQ